jgi:hypothetical protein
MLFLSPTVIYSRGGKYLRLSIGSGTDASGKSGYWRVGREGILKGRGRRELKKG